ncbi:MAG: arsenic efflux protein [Eubacterium sp.]|nr:arsenic efflux protein [Eubacterium sp.]
MQEALLESLIDSIKLIPFLLVTYLAMGMLERAASERSKKIIRKAGVVGPVWGALIGVIPQCGFSAAASFFYVEKAITLGTLISIYMATSDEMLPIFLSEHVAASTIVGILVAKVVIGMVSGFLIEAMFGWMARRRRIPADFSGELGTGCGCAADLLIDSVRKTIQVWFFILIVSVGISIIMEAVGQQAISSLIGNVPVVGEAVAGLVGLIPNCAASVIITQLYIDGVIGAGPMMTGLLASAGVGLLVLFREHHNPRHDLRIVGLLYIVSVTWGVVIELLGISF